jgi:hypothetical protein
MIAEKDMASKKVTSNKKNKIIHNELISFF